MLTMDEVSASIPCQIKLGTWYDGYHLNITTFTQGNGKVTLRFQFDEKG